MIFIKFIILVMVIGFTQRMVTISESMALPGEDFFNIDISVSTLRTSEREHPMVFRLQESTSSAIVVPGGDLSNKFLDAVFGTRAHSDDLIQQEFDLDVLVETIPSLPVDIRNDFFIEDEECFTIRIYAVDVPGRLELFRCNEEGPNFFCKHTICIQDDDGKNLACNLLALCVNIWSVHYSAICCWLCGDNIYS